jgi:hypothetical protein
MVLSPARASTEKAQNDSIKISTLSLNTIKNSIVNTIIATLAAGACINRACSFSSANSVSKLL